MGAGLLVGRLLLCGVLAFAGAAKLADRTGAREAVRSFGVPTRFAATAGAAVPLVELAAAALLLPAGTAWIGAAVGLVLLLGFTAALGVALARGRQPECHCFGQLRATRAGPGALARNLALAVVAAFIVLEGARDSGPSAIAWVGNLSSTAAVGLSCLGVIAILLAFQGWFSLQLLRQNGRLIDRLEALEHQLGIASPKAAPSAAPDPLSARGSAGRAAGGGLRGLPVGSPAPPFVLPTLTGEARTLQELCGDGPALLLFSDPGCAPCVALLSDVADWQRTPASRLSVVLVSSGDVEVNRANAAEHGLGEVLLQSDREVAEAYGGRSTPSAVLISRDQRIASRLAAGAEAIRRLVGEALRAPSPPPVIRPAEIPRPAALSEGEDAARFTLPSLEGTTVRLSDFAGRRLLLVFWNPRCGFCQRMLPAVRGWESNRPDEGPELVLISAGTVEANRAMGLRTPVLLDHGGGTMRAYGARGTPMAVIVDERGRLASGLLAGADAVMAAAWGEQRERATARSQ